MSGRVPWLYVVTKPDEARNIYETWDQCREAVRGLRGTCFMKVYDRAEAEAILSGRGVVLAPGLYAFTDANALGGIGVVIVRATQANEEPRIEEEVPTSVQAVFARAGIAGLDSQEKINSALALGRNPFAEMAALYAALRALPVEAEATIVHDYLGVGAFMEDGRWRAKKAPMVSVVGACRLLAEEKQLRLAFLHQPGHRSSWCARHDLARFNALADDLSGRGSGTTSHNRFEGPRS